MVVPRPERLSQPASGIPSHYFLLGRPGQGIKLHSVTKVRLGIIGMGNIGQHHAGYLSAGKINRAELVAVSDAIPGKLDKYQAPQDLLPTARN